MIPKIIHYVWLGKGQKSDLILNCIDSWKKVLPDYHIKEWNESNFDINSHHYVKKAYEEKRWAFASDLVRLMVLKREGGIYLDTDMYVIKSFDDFLDTDLVLGKEDDVHISAGMIASSPDNFFINTAIDKYYNLNEYITIPRILSNVYDSLPNKESVKVFDPVYFYPFNADNIKKFNFKNAPEESYAVHMWDYSWGNKYIKLIKKLGIHKFLVSILDKLKIKKILKKIFKIV